MAAAVLAPLLWTSDPIALNPVNRLKPPGETFWLGTDMYGRDVWSRVVYGSRVSLTIGLSAAALSIALGLLVGMVAGYVRWLDGVVMRVMDGLLAIPGLLLAIALVSLSRSGERRVGTEGVGT